MRARASALARWAPLAAAVLVGALIAVQSRLNGELAHQLGNALEAAVWSFGSGLVLLLVLVGVRPAIRDGLRRMVVALRSGGLRWWQVLGGLLGGFFVGVQSATVPVLGVAIFSVALVAGQSANSLVVDRVGLGPAGVQAITGPRLASAGLAIVAVTVAVANRVGGAGFSAVAVALAVAAGCGIAVQQALNGRIALTAGSPTSATVVNFAFGTLGLVVALVVTLVARGESLQPLGGAPWWSYLGGLVGMVFIAVAAWVVPIVGVLLFALLSIAGQLAASLLFDLVAPTSGAVVGWNLVAGVLLAFVAVAVAARGRVTT